MNEKKEIVVVGSCMIDFVCYAPRLPKEGETIHGYKFNTNFGGKGANQCVAAAYLGGNTALIARVGDDLWGEKYIDHLKKTKVDTTFVKKTSNSATGIAQITVSDTGQNQIVIVAGANTKLSVEDVKSAKELISSAEVVVCQLETSIDVAVETLTICSKISILNAAPSIKEYETKLLSLPTIFCVNEVEIEDFTGVTVNSLDDGREAVQRLLRKGCKSVILTLGSQGALYATPDRIDHVTTPTVKCVDTTGAGDAFIGALAYLLAHEKNSDILEIIKFACFAATDSVTRPGTQASFPDLQIFSKYDEMNN
ncbi:ribokinase-like [Agrilus planipennis]|uniref:Ribokinase n=1 Tax=Agrilus planipennis TaxID=224129 RepID=A0A1W4WDZ1_AGRPL|nr:ribokinase-like [Agrilus planipennis]